MSSALSFLNPLAADAASVVTSGIKARATSTNSTNSTSSTGSTSSTDSSQTSLGSLGQTFLQLLTQELQNQDPTAPMDSTQMVGQMISLNQLDQLASINQLLTTQFSSAGASTSTGTGTASANAVANAASVQAALSQMNAGALTAASLSANSPSIF